MDAYNGDETNYTYIYMDSNEGMFSGSALFQCIIGVIGTIVYILITSALISDRQQYQKTFWWALLNFSLTYILYCIVKYFAEVHIVIFPENNKSVCHLVLFLNNVLGNGSEMVILPVCIDLIVKIKRAEYYERRKYRSFLLILILAIWLVIIINEIIKRKYSEFEMYCFESNPEGILWLAFAFSILRTLIILVAAIFLVFLAITSDQLLSQLAGMIAAPVLICIVICVANIMFSIYHVLFINNYGQMINIGLANYYIRLFVPIMSALLWLLNNELRESVKKLLTCSPCRKTGPQPTEHELTTDIS